VRDCQKKKKQYDRNGGVSRADDQNDSDTVRGQTYLRLVVNGKPSKCLLDTGSDVTLLPTSLVIGLRMEPTRYAAIETSANSKLFVGQSACDVYATIV